MSEPCARDPARAGTLVDHLFRHQYGRMVAGLTRVFGSDYLDLVEDVVQEALLRALRAWPFEGIPREPEAWLVQVARNLALDALRHKKMTERKQAQLDSWADAAGRAHIGEELPAEVADDTLSMMFMCCHPSLAASARVALTLKTLCGFGVDEIARALLAKEATVAQGLTRAKARLQREVVAFSVPPAHELPARLDSVLDVLYLLFNAGYSAAKGENMVREDLVREAMRLVALLLSMPSTAMPKVHALASLLHFQAARLPARIDAVGEPLTLPQQDRARWDRTAIAAGFAHFERSLDGAELTSYHVEAAIASCHAAAPSYADTDWCAILRRFDQLVQIADSPVVRLNRAVAVAKVHGVAPALVELDALDDRLTGYYLLPATRAQLLWASGELPAAAKAFAAALRCACSVPERAFLQRRLLACERGETAPVF